MNADLDGADSRWLIAEDGFTAVLANTYETLFTTGNGYLGTRGSLEEGHEGALPGTFLRGVFDHHDSAVPDLVKAPDWLTLAVVVNGIRLDVTSVSVVRHRRMLDMREGALLRDTVFDLVVLIASRANHILGQDLSRRTQGLVERMGALASAMWRQAVDSWYQRDRCAGLALGGRDEEMDELHASLIAELASGRMALPVTMEMTLVARFYERLGDHAVNIARRVVYLAGSAAD